MTSATKTCRKCYKKCSKLHGSKIKPMCRACFEKLFPPTPKVKKKIVSYAIYEKEEAMVTQEEVERTIREQIGTMPRACDDAPDERVVKIRIFSKRGTRNKAILVRVN